LTKTENEDRRRSKVATYNKEVEDAGVADGRVAPALLPMYTDERIRERQLTTKYVGNVR
jgi:hypothetical protein